MFMFNYNCVFLCFVVCNRSYLNKICLCCFLDIHLYSNSLSRITTISSFIISELFPACLSCSNNFNRSQSSLESDCKTILIEIPEAEKIKPCDLSNFMSIYL